LHLPSASAAFCMTPLIRTLMQKVAGFGAAEWFLNCGQHRTSRIFCDICVPKNCVPNGPSLCVRRRMRWSIFEALLKRSGSPILVFRRSAPCSWGLASPCLLRRGVFMLRDSADRTLSTCAQRGGLTSCGSPRPDRTGRGQPRACDRWLDLCVNAHCGRVARSTAHYIVRRHQCSPRDEGYNPHLRMRAKVRAIASREQSGWALISWMRRHDITGQVAKSRAREGLMDIIRSLIPRRISRAPCLFGYLKQKEAGRRDYHTGQYRLYCAQSGKRNAQACQVRHPTRPKFVTAISPARPAALRRRAPGYSGASRVIQRRNILLRGKCRPRRAAHGRDWIPADTRRCAPHLRRFLRILPDGQGCRLRRENQVL